MLFLSKTILLKLFIALKMAYCCCLGLRGKLDFPDFLQKKVFTCGRNATKLFLALQKNGSGVDVINKFQSSAAKLCRNKALYLAFASHVTSFSQLKCSISTQRKYAALKFNVGPSFSLLFCQDLWNLTYQVAPRIQHHCQLVWYKFTKAPPVDW